MRRIILFTIILLFLLPLSFAYEDFRISAPLKAQVCSDTTSPVRLTLENTGTQHSTYFIKETASSATHAEYAGDFFTLQQGERRIFEFLIYYNGPGEETLTYYIETNKGLTRSYEQSIQVVDCTPPPTQEQPVIDLTPPPVVEQPSTPEEPAEDVSEAPAVVQAPVQGMPFNNYLLATAWNATGCPCTPYRFTLTLMNTGPTIETYAFSLDRYAEGALISHNPLILNPGQSQEITLDITPDCATYGTQIVYLRSTAQSSGLTVEVPLQMVIDACYDYSLDVGEPQGDNASEAGFAFFDGGYNLCQGDMQLIPVRVENTADIDNNYTLMLENAPSYVTLVNDSFSLEAGEDVLTLVQVDVRQVPTEAHFVLLNMHSALGDERRQALIDLSVNECYLLGLELPASETVCGYELHSFDGRVMNNGLFDESIIFSSEQERWISLPDNFTVDAESSEDFTLSFLPEENTSMYLITLDTTLENGRAHASAQMRVDVRSYDQCHEHMIDTPRSIRVRTSTVAALEMTHTGIEEATFTFSLNGPEWVSIEPREVTLAPGEEVILSISAEGDDIEAGTYYADIISSSDEMQQTTKLKFIVRQGDDIWDTLHYYRYWIFLFLILIIAFFIILHFARKQAKKRKVRKIIKSFKGNGNGKPTVWTKVFWWIVCVVIIICVLNRTFGWFPAALDAAVPYLRWVLLGVVLLWVIIAIMQKAEK